MNALTALLKLIGAVFLYLISPEHREAKRNAKQKKTRRAVVAGDVDRITKHVDELLARYRRRRRENGKD